jgi:hypothetical protein
MKKNKLFILLSIVTMILIFGVAATCSLCSTPVSLGDTDENEAKEAKDGTEDREKTNKQNADKDGTGVAQGEEEAITNGGETKKADEALSAPTINLEVYIGPEYSSSDGLCYYRVEANVTGNPTPIIEFNKDDSSGTLGNNRAQVNLKSTSDVCQLEATATNSEGTATDSIILYWGCDVLEVENSDPVILEITILGNPYITIKRKYEIEASAFDPDGDDLTYSWFVIHGSNEEYVHKPNEQTTSWTAPSKSGNSEIVVKVSDGKGGVAEAKKTIFVHFLYDLLERAPGADWMSSATWFLDWGGATNDKNGFACYQTNILLEDGNTYAKVLETHPPWVNNSRIRGDFERDHFIVPEGARFTAKVGFINGATSTDGVKFFVSFTDTNGIMYDFPKGGHLAKYDETLDELNLDLSSIVGKSGYFSLGVNAAGTSAQDWAVWVDPKIIN